MATSREAMISPVAERSTRATYGDASVTHRKVFWAYGRKPAGSVAMVVPAVMVRSRALTQAASCGERVIVRWKSVRSVGR